MKYRIIAFAILLGIFAAHECNSKQKAKLVSYVAVPVDSMGYCYFKMMPDPTDPTNESVGIGEMHRLDSDGNDKVLWKTKGWYAENVIVLGDCYNLVRMGTAYAGGRVSPNDIAFAFYKNGSLIKEYTIGDVLDWDFNQALPKRPYDRFLFKHGFLLSVPTIDSNKGQIIFSTIDGKRHKYGFEYGSKLSY